MSPAVTTQLLTNRFGPYAARGSRRSRNIFTVHARNGQLYNVLFADDPISTDAQTVTFNALVNAPAAKDRRTFDETAVTQILFAGTWGAKATQQWGTEHNAELKRLGM